MIGDSVKIFRLIIPIYTFYIAIVYLYCIMPFDTFRNRLCLVFRLFINAEPTTVFTIIYPWYSKSNALGFPVRRIGVHEPFGDWYLFDQKF